MMRQWAK
jgi:hypothetical protein